MRECGHGIAAFRVQCNKVNGICNYSIKSVKGLCWCEEGVWAPETREITEGTTESMKAKVGLDIYFKIKAYEFNF